MRSLFALPLFLVVSCSSRDRTTRSAVRDTSTAAITPPPQPVSGSALAGVHLCDALAQIVSLFPSARDTIVRGEGDSKWPSKVLQVGADGSILFESSWVDTSHVWRISTNSPRFESRSGLRVGSRVDKLLARGDSLEAEYAEGRLALYLPRDSVGFLIDPNSEAVFSRRFNEHDDPRRVLSPNAQIKYLVIVADCRSSKSAA